MHHRMFGLSLCFVCIFLLTFVYVPATYAESPSKRPSTKSSRKTAQATQPAPAPRKLPKKKTKRPAPNYEAVTVGDRQREDAFRSARSLNVLDRKRLAEKRPRTVPEALMEEAGIFVQKTNHGAGAPILRGTIGPQVLILMDGVRMNNSTYRSGPNQYLNIVDPWSLGRIEVLRGPGSLAYGTQAFGGVISLESRAPRLDYTSQPGFGGELIGRYGSTDNERTGRSALEFRLGGFGIRAGVTYSDFGDLRPGGALTSTGNTTLLRSKTPFGDLVTDSTTGAQAYGAYRALFVDVNAQGRFNETWSLSAVYQRAMLFHAGRTDQLASNGDLRFYDNTRDLAYLRLKGNFASIRTKIQLTLSFQNQLEEIERPRYDKETLLQLQRTDRSKDNTLTLGSHLSGETQFNDIFKLSYGLEHYSDMIDSEASRDGKSRTPAFSPGSTYHTLGAYVIGRVKVWGWEPESGIYTQIGGRLGGFFANSPARDTIEAVSFQQLGYALAGSVQFLYRRALNVSFSYAEGLRAPNLQETTTIGDTGNAFEVPNPNLRPEVSRSLELAIRGRFNDRFTAWVSGYYSFWQDLITRGKGTYQGQDTVDGKPVEQNINQERADIMGVESGLSVWIIAGLSASASLTWTRGIAYLEGDKTEPVSRIPPLFSTLALRYNFDRWAFLEFFTVLAATQDQLSARDKTDVRIPEGGTPGWFTLNIRGGASINRHLRIALTVENLLNAPYKYHGSGMLGAGLGARISLEGRL
ncbi:MAG: TonB-dependent receptor [Myxococcales bacterium]|nr:TonB-dependent receptor [Myxococcales bacterium]